MNVKKEIKKQREMEMESCEIFGEDQSFSNNSERSVFEYNLVHRLARIRLLTDLDNVRIFQVVYVSKSKISSNV